MSRPNETFLVYIHKLIVLIVLTTNRFSLYKTAKEKPKKENSKRILLCSDFSSLSSLVTFIKSKALAIDSTNLFASEEQILFIDELNERSGSVRS